MWESFYLLVCKFSLSSLISLGLLQGLFLFLSRCFSTAMKVTSTVLMYRIMPSASKDALASAYLDLLLLFSPSCLIVLFKMWRSSVYFYLTGMSVAFMYVVCMCTSCMPETCESQTRAADTGTGLRDPRELSRRCCQLNLPSLQEPWALLTAELPLSSPKFFWVTCPRCR